MKSIKCNTTKPEISAVFLGLALFLLGTVNISFAKEITLVWDPSPSPNIVGYNVYYQVNTTSFPFNGTGLPVGPSPIGIDGSKTSSLTFNLPDDGNLYYFTVTAVNDASLESSFSNIAATEWIPPLLAPTENAAIDTVATFVWNQPAANFKPSTSIISFDLIYGTDPDLNENVTAFTAPNIFKTNWLQPEFNIAITLTILLLLLMVVRNSRIKSAWHPVRVSFCIGVFVLQASCGGGGGSDENDAIPGTSAPATSAPATSAPEPAPLFTNVVTDINATEYEVTDLQPGTQYYWKIIAVDNWGITYESITQKFTTIGN
jgi:hypothetical protein